jgi:hypothetical protein
MTNVARQRIHGARTQRGDDGPAHEHDLYSAAIAMLESARDMTAAAASAGAAAAIPAALTPLETALRELERTAGMIETVARQRLSTASRLGGRWDHDNMMRTLTEFEDLTRALRMARLACTTARDCAGPVLAELTRI